MPKRRSSSSKKPLRRWELKMNNSNFRRRDSMMICRSFYREDRILSTYKRPFKELFLTLPLRRLMLMIWRSSWQSRWDRAGSKLSLASLQERKRMWWKSWITASLGLLRDSTTLSSSEKVLRETLLWRWEDRQMVMLQPGTRPLRDTLAIESHLSSNYYLD